MSATTDQIRGGLVAVMVGDALGAPYEFYADRNRTYDGKMTLEPRIYNKYTKSFRSGVVGQITDDSEMTMVNWRVIASIGPSESSKDIRKKFIEAYIDWANSDTRMMGKNTRSLFRGIKTQRGYETRALKSGLSSESNGTLMRALPFAHLDRKLGDKLAKISSKLTNDNETTEFVISTYLELVRGLLSGDLKRKNIEKFAKERDIDVDKELDQGFTKSETKGWVRYPLVYLIWCLKNFPLEPESLKNIADDLINHRRGCDSDTILSIVFGVYGSVIGFQNLSNFTWFRKILDKVLECDTLSGGFPRPEKFWANTFYLELEELDGP